jgi:hypothetical protein
MCASFGATAVLDHTGVFSNEALGGAGAVGGTGGDGLGGGLFNAPVPPGSSAQLTLLACRVLVNQADGGAVAPGAHAGVGAGVGGGVYSLGRFSFDEATLIALNEASTSHDNIYP